MKRRFSQVQDEPVLRLQLADDAPDMQPLEVSVSLMRASSSCARGLPHDSSTWDLSNLLIDGHPVSRDTVTAWVNVVYTILEDKPFKMDTSPAESTSATRLYQVLAFADAVGSSRGVVKACLAGLQQLVFEVKVGDKEVQLAADQHHGWINDTLYVVKQLGFMADGPKPAAGKDQQNSATQQLVSQLEPLLYLAYRLQLAPLQEVLHAFTRNNTSCGGAILYGHIRHVLTQRVIQAAADCDVGVQGLLQLLVAQRGSLLGKQDGLFEPVGADSITLPVVKFQAKVKKPLPGLTLGDVVDVELNRSTNRLKTGGFTHEARLLVGQLVDTPPGMQALLGEEDAASAKSS